jgi:hypothetical protein
LRKELVHVFQQLHFGDHGKRGEPAQDEQHDEEQHPAADGAEQFFLIGMDELQRNWFGECHTFLFGEDFCKAIFHSAVSAAMKR